MNGTGNEHQNMNNQVEEDSDKHLNGFVDLTDEPVEEEDQVVVDDNITVTNLLHNTTNNNNKANWQDEEELVNKTNTNVEGLARLSPRNFIPKSTRALMTQQPSDKRAQKIDAVDILSDLTPVAPTPVKSIEEHLKESLYVTASRVRPTVIDRIVRKIFKNFY